MKKIIFHAVLFIAAFFAATSCNRGYLGYEEAPANYYLLTLENLSGTDVVWFVPYHSGKDCSLAGELPESLSGMDNCSFFTKAHERMRVNVTEDRNGPFESYHTSDLVSVYVFDAEVFENEPWADVRNGEKWLAKYRLSAREVIDSGKKISYTGK